MNAKATKAYNDRIKQVRKLIASITKGLDEHKTEAGDRVNWAHVGDLGCLIETLTEADQFING